VKRFGKRERRRAARAKSVFVWSEISASGELGLLPPPLSGEGMHRVRGAGRALRRRALSGDSSGRRGIKKDEAGEGHSHAPRRYPSPASLAGALSLTHRLPGPHTSGSGHHTPNVPHTDSVSRKNGKKKLQPEFSPAQKMAKKARLNRRSPQTLRPRPLACNGVATVTGSGPTAEGTMEIL
jgi:hypothetical protein